MKSYTADIPNIDNTFDCFYILTSKNIWEEDYLMFLGLLF